MKIRIANSTQPDVEIIKVSSFSTPELRCRAAFQLIYSVITTGLGVSYTVDQTRVIYQVLNNINLAPYIDPVFIKKDGDSLFLLCSEVANAMSASGIYVDADTLMKYI